MLGALLTATARVLPSACRALCVEPDDRPCPLPPQPAIVASPATSTTVSARRDANLRPEYRRSEGPPRLATAVFAWRRPQDHCPRPGPGEALQAGGDPIAVRLEPRRSSQPRCVRGDAAVWIALERDTFGTHSDVRAHAHEPSATVTRVMIQPGTTCHQSSHDHLRQSSSVQVSPHCVGFLHTPVPAARRSTGSASARQNRGRPGGCANAQNRTECFVPLLDYVRLHDHDPVVPTTVPSPIWRALGLPGQASRHSIAPKPGKPSASAAAPVRSQSRPGMYGPRSITGTRMARSP